MTLPPAATPARRIGFLLIGGHALMSTAAAVEPLRAANLLAGRLLYRIEFLSGGGGAVSASVGAHFDTLPVARAGMGWDIVFVVAGGDPFSAGNPAELGFLRRLERAGVRLGGISGGAVLLARAGLLGNRRFTLHWEHVESLRRLFPEALIERRLFVIDRDRLTCAGGVAPLDMMHAMIAADHGAGFARLVSDWFIHTDVRLPEAPQRADAASRWGTSHPGVLAAIELMESHVADPLGPVQLASLTGISARQLQRLFPLETGQPMMRFYRALRLERAEALLRQGRLPVAEIAEATGFADLSAFTRSFRQHFGQPPAARRRVLAGGASG